MTFDILIFDANQIVTVNAHGKSCKAGTEMRDLGVIENGAVGIKDNLITFVGSSDDVSLKDAEFVLDGMGRTVLPGFIDSHTHLVFAGNREAEFARRVAGESYADIAASGGGINTTVTATRAARPIELIEAVLHRLDNCLSFGTTTVEIKSGYGLDFENEIKILEVIRELEELHVVEIAPTFLGAHTIPREYKDRRGEYVDLIVDKMLPEIARRGLAEFCDAFIEKTAFTIDEGRRILEAAKHLGMKLRIHADQITPNGGSELAAELGAVSADHLDHISDAAIGMLKESGTIATLLPGVSLFLGEPMPDARRLIDAGLPVAVATDANPGSCMSENIQLMMSLASMQMRMTMEEAITAVTLNAAAALNRSATLGSIEVGKQADLLLFDVPNYKQIIYHYGVNHLTAVIKNGLVVVEKTYTRE